MDEQETKVTDTEAPAKEEPTLRPWVTPVFQMAPLNDALSAMAKYGADILGYS
ncbi:hypothetical protein FJY63_13045 [Candidatus Sumerlaeota bacterium]|nr:hypothetical protein [Candidatus Sumerlaeota bacterium]